MPLLHYFGTFDDSGVWRKLFSMPEEDQASGEMLPQNGYPLRWIVFVLMWIFGMMTIVMHVATQGAGWDWKVFSYVSVKQLK